MKKCLLCDNCDSREATIIKLRLANSRDFYFCKNCYLIFVTDEGRLGFEEEKGRYLLHQNRKDDNDYVNFLRKAIDPSLSFLKEGMVCLDYGCGHTPVLASILTEIGYICDLFDPFFFPSIKRQQYDLIFSTEAVEHFFNPKKEFDRFDHLLVKDGYLVIMTSFWKDLDSFDNWYYKNDPAHVVFYHFKTFQFIAETLNYKIVYTDSEKVIIFQKC